MIVTCKKEIPFRWVFFAIMPWGTFAYTWGVVGVAFLFSLKKFIENPAGLTFILSLPMFVSMVMAPSVSFLSDRIWTRFGRRKPFIVTSWIGVSCCLVLLPLMPNFWALFVVYMFYSFFFDLTAPIEPLKLEIIPPHQRVRATGALQWCTTLAYILFYFVALGRFDDVRFMRGVPISGEEVIYWSAALMLLVMLLLIMLGIKEVDQKSPLRGQRFTIKTFFLGILDGELWPVYILAFGSAALGSGLGPLGNLLYTDQWGYSKQEMGINIAAGGTINLCIIGLLAVFADKLNRMRAYQTLIVISLTINVLYFCYVTYLLPNQRASLIEMIVFGESGSIIGMLTTMIYVPLVYDYIRRNKMGTYAAGAGIVNRMAGFITLNGVGLFIWGYAMLFQPPAGEMARVVVRDAQSQQTKIQSLLQAAQWSDPGTGIPVASSAVVANAWQANGTISSSGRAWEIRLHDKASEKLATAKEELDKERSFLLADEKMLRDQIRIRKSHADNVAKLVSKADEKLARQTTLAAQIDRIDATLAKRAKRFQEEVAAVLGTHLITEGSQVLSAHLGMAVVMELATAKRSDPRLLEKILSDLREKSLGVIDLRPLKLASGYGVEISARAPTTLSEADFAQALQSSFASAARQRDPLLLPEHEIRLTREPVLQLDLMVVEDSLDTYVSPITRGVNLILGLFDAVPRPDHRLTAIARGLRTPNNIHHVRLESGPAPKTITVTALLPDSAPRVTTNDPVTRALQSFLGTGDALAQARAFYDRIENVAATQKITVARPLLTSVYVPMKYNYMSGYLWMVLMGVVGISITILFRHLETLGFIHKRGIEEEEAL